LYEAENQVGELVRYDGRDQDEQDAGCNDALQRAGDRECCYCSSNTIKVSKLLQEIHQSINSPSVIIPQSHVSDFGVAEGKHLCQCQCDVVKHNADADADDSKQRDQPEEERIIGAEQKVILCEL
jgi:hypothetical protein